MISPKEDKEYGQFELEPKIQTFTSFERLIPFSLARFVFRSIVRSFQAMNLEFLGRIRELGFRVRRRENGRWEERKKEKSFTKWMEPGAFSFYIHAWVGLTQTRPTLFYCWPFDSDPDGSGSIQRSWGVSLIRIHQIRGLDQDPLGFCVFPFSFLFFVICTPVLLSESLCILILFAKIPKNCHVFLMYFGLFCNTFYRIKIDKNDRC